MCYSLLFTASQNLDSLKRDVTVSKFIRYIDSQLTSETSCEIFYGFRMTSAARICRVSLQLTGNLEKAHVSQNKKWWKGQ